MAVYAVTSGVHDAGGLLVKIGYTARSIDSRISELKRTGSPADIRMVAVNKDGSRDDEARIHQMLDGVGRRRFNEWFVFPSEVYARELVSSLGDVSQISDDLLQDLYLPIKGPGPNMSLEDDRTMPVLGVETRDNGVGRGWYSIRALFARDYGFFKLAPTMRVLWGGRLLAAAHQSQPRCVFLACDRDISDALCLFVRVAPTSYGADLRALIDAYAIDRIAYRADGDELLVVDFSGHLA